MSNLDNTINFISELSSGYDSVVVYSSTLQLARANNANADEIAKLFVDKLIRAIPGKTILMPTFSSGYDSKNLLSLDTSKSTTGLITEYFRTHPSTQRTISAFFSFGVQGYQSDDLLRLQPSEAWGKNSLYEWIHINNSLILTVGLNPTHCSFTHYAEFLNQDIINYRMKKTVSGKVLLRGTIRELEETLLVRHTKPPAKNDFTWLAPHYESAGQRIKLAGEVLVSGISAQDKMAVVLPFVKKNPYALVKKEE